MCVSVCVCVCVCTIALHVPDIKIYHPNLGGLPTDADQLHTIVQKVATTTVTTDCTGSSNTEIQSLLPSTLKTFYVVVQIIMSVAVN